MGGARFNSILSRTTLNSLPSYPCGDTPNADFGSRSAWDIHGQPADNVSANMAEYALGSIVTMATNNPTVQIPGNLPILGSRLKINWAFAIALLICIAGVHSALFILAFNADRWNRHHTRSESEQLTNVEHGEN